MDKMHIRVLYALLMLSVVNMVNANPISGVWRLFGGYGDYNGYNGGYASSGRRGYGRSYGGDGRYKSICRVHAADSVAFPGRVGNPVCPY